MIRKIIAAINMTLDGNFDHKAGIADEELHQHYTELLSTVDAVLYGRITYQLMEYWRTVAKKSFRRKSHGRIFCCDGQRFKNCFFKYT